MQTQVYPHVPVDPNDPRLHTPEDEPRFRKAQARALHALGLVSKAIRLEACGTVWRYMGNDICEPWRENNSRCGFRSCVPCAHRDAKIALALYGPLGASKLIADTILFGDWRDVLPCSPAVLRDLGNRLVALRRSIGHRVPLFARIGMFMGHATMRLLYGGPDAASVNKQVLKFFPKMHVALRPKSEFETALALLLDPQLSQDPGERAAYELMFNGIRQLRVSGVSRAELNVYGGKTITPKSEVLDPRFPCPDCGEPAIRKVSCCPDCGKPPTWISQWTNKDPRDVKPTDLKRYNVVPYVATAHNQRC